MPTQSKIDLRKKFRAICGEITLAYREEAAFAAKKIWVDLPLFKESEHVACYLPTKNEFDSSPIIETIWQAKKRCYLPIVQREQDQKNLVFAHYQYGDALHINHHGILEPVHVHRTITPQALDLVILPLIAFDCYGHRLGTGGGYYDRTFAFLTKQLNKKPMLIGLGYTVQQIDMLPSDEWDVLLNGVLTEHEFIPCS